MVLNQHLRLNNHNDDVLDSTSNCLSLACNVAELNSVEISNIILKSNRFFVPSTELKIITKIFATQFMVLGLWNLG